MNSQQIEEIILYLTLPFKCVEKIQYYEKILTSIEVNISHPIIKNYLIRAIDFIKNKNYDFAISCLTLANSFYG